MSFQVMKNRMLDRRYIQTVNTFAWMTVANFNNFLVIRTFQKDGCYKICANSRDSTVWLTYFFLHFNHCRWRLYCCSIDNHDPAKNNAWSYLPSSWKPRSIWLFQQRLSHTRVSRGCWCGSQRIRRWAVAAGRRAARNSPGSQKFRIHGTEIQRQTCCNRYADTHFVKSTYGQRTTSGCFGRGKLTQNAVWPVFCNHFSIPNFQNPTMFFSIKWFMQIIWNIQLVPKKRIPNFMARKREVLPPTAFLLCNHIT